MDSHYFDQHTLYAEIGDATHEQLQYVIQSIISQLNKKCKYRINIVESKSGFRCAYIYITNKQVYYAAIGKNLDGTNRVKYVDDPNFIMPSIPLEVALQKYYTVNTTQSFSWADDAEELEDIENKYKCPKIEIREPPLVNIPNYKKNTSFPLGPAYVKHIPPNYKPNVLVCFNIPKWMTTDDLKFHFKIFNTYNCNRLSRSDPNKKQFPIISIKHDPDGSSKKSSVRIIFSDKTNDAHFALLFSKYITITNKYKTESHLCKFWYLKHYFHTGSQ